MSCNSKQASDQAGPYAYQVLDVEQRQIGVLTLLPGSWYDPISCELEVVSLNDDPAYFALSYVWGDPKVTLPILLHKHALQVTSNLENALRRLRGSTKPRVIWIDALCINQEDDIEDLYYATFGGRGPGSFRRRYSLRKRSWSGALSRRRGAYSPPPPEILTDM
jgi:hypothetical protein